MDNVKEYKSVAAWGTDELNVIINKLIKEGWKPIGGIAMTYAVVTQAPNKAQGFMFSQAMVK